MALQARRSRRAPQLETVAESDHGLISIFDAARNMIDLPRRTVSAARNGLRYREFLDALGVAVYTTDADGRITFYNEAAATFWGRRPELGEEWCGSLRLFWSDGQADAARRVPDGDRSPREPARSRLRGARRAAGRQSDRVRALSDAAADDDGALIGAVNVLIDVTDRRKAEDALIANAEALRGSNAVKDEFLGLVSHELRTPVTTIFGNAQVLRDKGDALGEDARRSMVADIAEDSERLLGIIENLLLLTRLGSGPKPDVEPQVLNHVVRKSIDSFTRRHAGRRVTFLGVARLLIVDADRTNIELLIENLLSNADKYSPPTTRYRRRPPGARTARRRSSCSIAGSAWPRKMPTRSSRRSTGRSRRRSRRTGSASAWPSASASSRATAAGSGPKPRDGGGSEFGFALPIGQALVDLD